MPQFNFATFTPQIFWLLICFAVLYYFVSRVIGPRIASVLAAREAKISLDQNSAGELQIKIDEIQAKSQKLKHESSTNYQKSIDEALKNCAIDREKSLNKVKADIAEISTQSGKKIEDFINQSQADCSKLATQFAESLLKKFFNQDLKLGGEVKVDVNELKS